MKSFFKSIDLKTISTIGIHIVIFCLIYFFAYTLGVVKVFPNNGTLMQWDAGWYKSIIDGGYSYTPGEPSNVAFFPLFPMVWKILHVSPLTISAFNFILMIIGTLFLNSAFKLSRTEYFIILSVPSLFFCFVPYSEAFFYVSGAMFIWGLKRNFKFAVLGIFAACLSRSTAMAFLPIIIFVLLYNLRKKNNKKILIQAGILVLTTIIATLLAQYIQYIKTGQLFATFEMQKAWGKVLSIPQLFLTTWDRERLLWLDGLAFFSGIISLFIIILLIIRKIKNINKTIAPYYLFSISYLVIITAVTTLFAVVDGLGGTSIYSLNRYIFATPFFAVFLILTLRYVKFNKKTVITFILISAVTWALFNVQGTLLGFSDRPGGFWLTKFYFGALFIYSFMYLLFTRKENKELSGQLIYTVSIILQFFLFTQFLQGAWVG